MQLLFLLKNVITNRTFTQLKYEFNSFLTKFYISGGFCPARKARQPKPGFPGFRSRFIIPLALHNWLRQTFQSLPRQKIKSGSVILQYFHNLGFFGNEQIC